MKTGPPGAGGRHADFEALYERYRRDVWALAYARWLNADTGQDIVQETFLRLWKQWEAGEVIVNPRAWLLAILRNTFLNGYRRRNLERRVFDGPDGEALAPGWIGAASLRAMRDPHSGAARDS